MLYTWLSSEYFYAFIHHGAGDIIFLGCLSVCVCMRTYVLAVEAFSDHVAIDLCSYAVSAVLFRTWIGGRCSWIYCMRRA